MIKSFIEKRELEYYSDVSLKKYNTYRVDCKCKYLVLPNDKEEFRDLVKYLVLHEEKFLVLGNGSNVIFLDDYYDGVVILLNKLNDLKIDGEDIEVGAGYSLQRLAIYTSNLGLEGLEFATGIPGFVGASVAMNAGAYQSSLSDVVTSVLVLNSDFEFVTMKNKELKFAYRDSFFKHNQNCFIVSVCMELKQGDKQEIMERISKRRVRRLETQPLDMPSAGSVFRNPEGMHAGALIEDLGLKGFSIGGAQVSEKHANFIVNTGGATGKEIVQVIDRVKEEVMETYHVELVLEQIIIE